MRKQLFTIMVFCAACLVLGAQAQTPSDTSGGSSSETPGAPSSSSGAAGTMGEASSAHSGWAGHRMAHQDVRATQLSGAQINSTSDQPLGTISDTIINPASGRVVFAVVSLKSGKQVAVPWMLLRPSMAEAAAPGKAPTFTFTGNISKLESAPAFEASTDLTEPNWRQSVFAHYGLIRPSPAMGGAETPGGMGPSGSSEKPQGSSGPSSTTPSNP